MNNGKAKEFDLNLASEAFGMIRLGDDLIAPATISRIRLLDDGSIEIELLSGNLHSFGQAEASQLQSWLEDRKAEAQRARMNIPVDPRGTVIDLSKLRR